MAILGKPRLACFIAAEDDGSGTVVLMTAGDDDGGGTVV